MIGIMNRNRAVVSAALAGRDPKKQRAPPERGAHEEWVYGSLAGRRSDYARRRRT